MRAHIAAPARRPSQSEDVADPYMKTPSMPEPAVCIGCGAVFQKGRWQWAMRTPKGAARETCQACLRMEDDFPAGVLTLRGAYVQAHLKEILTLARHHEHAEMKNHPLRRIMIVEERRNSVVIKTTDISLPGRIGRALQRDFKGELKFRYDKDAYFVRADWRR